MSEDFYPFVDSGDPAPDNRHLNGVEEEPQAAVTQQEDAAQARYATRIAIYDDMLSTPRVIVVEPHDVRTYLEETTNTVYRSMKEQGGSISLMVIREIVENFIHANFAEPIISILDGGNTIRFADQGPGIEDKERAFEFGVTSANRDMKRYIRGTGAGFPMVQQYIENKGGAVSIEDNMGQGTVVTVSVDPARVAELERSSGRGAAVRASEFTTSSIVAAQQGQTSQQQGYGMQAGAGAGWNQGAYGMQTGAPAQQPMWQSAPGQQAGAADQAATLQQPTTDPQASAQQNQWQGRQNQNTWQQAQNQMQGAYPQQAGTSQNIVQQPANPYGQNGAGMAGAFNPYAATPGQYPQGQYFPGQLQQGQPAYPYSYPQNAGMYQSYPQQQAQMGYPVANQPQMQSQDPYVSERGQQALAFLARGTQCGPTDLNRAFGTSVPTWSRELDKLAEAGLVIKRGQKFHLTELGQTWTQNRTA